MAMETFCSSMRDEMTAWKAKTYDLIRKAEEGSPGPDQKVKASIDDMLADPEVIRRSRWPHNIALLELARASACKVGLATMSQCSQVRRVLSILELNNAFDFVASREDVENGKPDPEMYLLVAEELEVQPEESLVIEDSPSGVRAAIAAGMSCIVVTTPFTRKAIHEQHLLNERWVVDDPTTLLSVVREMIEEKRGPEKETGEACLI